MKNELTREEWIGLARALNIGKLDISQLSSHDVKVFNEAKDKIIKSAYWMIEKVYGPVVGKPIIDEPVKSEQTLKEKLLDKQTESHQVWFGRWYEKNHIEHDLVIAASRNYSKFSISISDEDDMYLQRRLRDPKTIVMLKEEMPSIKISYEKTESKDIFGRRFYEEKILFDWGN